MKRSHRRIPKESVVGIEMSDTTMRFIVLAPYKTNHYYRVGTWGEQAIAYDAVKAGEIIEFTQVAQSVRNLQEKTGVHRIAFSSWGDATIDARWREVFEVGGFREVITLARARALDTLTKDTDGSAVPLLYFQLPDLVVLMHRGREHESYPYPLPVYAIESVREYIEDHTEDGVYRIVGSLPESAEATADELEACFVPTRPARIWRNVCDLHQYIPPILHEDSFIYALSLANAYTMIHGEYTPSDTPVLSHTTFRSQKATPSPSDYKADKQRDKAQDDPHSSGAFGRWFEKRSVDLHESSPSPASDSQVVESSDSESKDTSPS
ncbi:MAG: hypothetical protein ACKKL4_02390 [Patescibacteria group bacterium]